MNDSSQQSAFEFEKELVVDLFAGGGGASLGISRAYREPDVAVNHNPTAIAVHEINHPNTMHYTCDVFEVDPVVATGGRPVGVLWASPDCRHHSKAKGGKPRNKKIRGLAWVVTKWAAAVKPRLIELENVEEFADWGPLNKDGQPCKIRKGMTFRRWVRKLEILGYKVEHRELVAADYGVPTIRKRLYVSARCDGRPIVWPAPTHAKNPTGKLLPWNTAAQCIDFNLPAKSIFGRKKPLAENTNRRIAKGLWRYVLNNPKPYVVKPTFLTEHANSSSQRVFNVDEPLRTQVAQVKGGHFSLVAASLTTLRGTSESHLQGDDVTAPLGTVTGQGTHHALVAAHITKFRTGSVGTSIDEPLHTVTAGGDMARPAGAAHAMGLVCAYMEQANTGQQGRGIDTPMSTICTTGTHQQVVSAYLIKYYREGGQWSGCDEPMHTVPTKARMGLVEVIQVPSNILSPEQLEKARVCAAFMHEYLPEHFPVLADVVLVGDHALIDITLRMLVPRELARAQGFPDSYVIEFGANGKPITKTDQVKLIGNSVCPGVAEALIKANLSDLLKFYETVERKIA